MFDSTTTKTTTTNRRNIMKSIIGKIAIIVIFSTLCASAQAEFLTPEQKQALFEYAKKQVTGARLTDAHFILRKAGKNVGFQFSAEGTASIEPIDPGSYTVDSYASNGMGAAWVRADLFPVQVKSNATTSLGVTWKLSNSLPVLISIQPATGDYTEGERYAYSIPQGKFSDMSPAQYKDGRLNLDVYMYQPFQTETTLEITVTDDNSVAHEMSFIFNMDDFIASAGSRLELKPVPGKIEFKMTWHDYTKGSGFSVLHARQDGRCAHVTDTVEYTRQKLFCVNGDRYILGLGAHKGSLYAAVNRGAQVTIQRRDLKGNVQGEFRVATENGNVHGTLFDFAFDETGFWGVNSKIVHYSQNQEAWEIDREIEVQEGWGPHGVAYDSGDKILYVVIGDGDGVQRENPILITYDESGNEIRRANIVIDSATSGTAVSGLGFDSKTGTLWASMSFAPIDGRDDHLMNIGTDGKVMRTIPLNHQYGSVEVME